MNFLFYINRLKFKLYFIFIKGKILFIRLSKKGLACSNYLIKKLILLFNCKKKKKINIYSK